jgi:lipid II:glycine glycyltransferase (peptidoglycan interpeptide bridge formation enzyme)
MAQLRIIRPTRFNFGMAYLRWGPLYHRRRTELDSQIIHRMADMLQKEYVSKRRLLLQILPNAFAASSRAELFQSAFSTFRQERRTAVSVYRTLVLDLSPSLEELRRKLDPKWRNKLTGAEKNGLKVTSGSGMDGYRTFCRMYNQMRDRKTFDTAVDIEEFGRIQGNLPENQRMQIFICEQSGVPVAGVVASAMGDSAIYLLGATSDEGLRAKGSYLLQWTLIRWLKENGVRWYDLGGIDPEQNPGVYSFKRGLSGADVTQLLPLVACNSALSSVLVKTSLTIQTTLRGISNIQLPRSLSRAFAEK